MSNDTRVPAGVPTGGQFSASAKSEATGVSLSDGIPEIGQMVAVSTLKHGDRFVFSTEDGAADGDEIVTVIGANNTFGTVSVATEELDFDPEWYNPRSLVRVVPDNAVVPGDLRVGDKVQFGEGDDVSTVTSLDGDGYETSIEFDNDESTIASYSDGDLFLMVESKADQDAAAQPFTTVFGGGNTTQTCKGCGETNTQPDKGLGRANLAAWRTRHQH